jgi:hypothetical protein
MRRLIFSLICSSRKAVNVPKPASVGITSSQIRIALASHGRRALVTALRLHGKERTPFPETPARRRVPLAKHNDMIKAILPDRPKTDGAHWSAALRDEDVSLVRAFTAELA